jgi:hypothetical protein
VIDGSVYGRSMATAVALPDGRTNQILTRTIREAGEKFVDPPLIAVTDAIRGDIPTYAGGITSVDIEYDERLGEVLRPLTQDKGGMPIGMEIGELLRMDIRSAFFLDKIQLPETGKDMTAFEVRRRIEEHIRSASPIFEPVEKEYNGQLCDLVFAIMREANAFPMDEMPESLAGQDTEYTFRSPLADMADQNEAETYLDVFGRIIMPTAEADPAQMAQFNITKAARDAARAAGWKADWFNDPEEVNERRAQQEQQMQAAKAMEMANAAGQVGEQMGKAGMAIAEAERT